MTVISSNFKSKLMSGGAAVGGDAAIALSNLTVSESLVSGNVIGTLSIPYPGTWTFSVVAGQDAGGRVAVVGTQLRATSEKFDFETATSHGIRIKATRASPYSEIVTGFTLTVVDAEELVDLPLDNASYSFNLSAGTEMENLGSLLPGETRTISPDDGRVVFNGDQSKLLRGMTAWTAGDIAFTVTRVLPAAANSPRSQVWTVTVSDVPPETLTTTFGAKTRVGWGGYSLASAFPSTTPTITAGNAAGHWQLDDTKCIVPKNGAAAYGTAPPTFSGPYSLTVSDGSTTKIVNITTVANTFHIAAKNSGANSSDMQLTDVFYSAFNYLTLGDTVVMRPGDYNPNHADQRIGPRSSYTGSGRITLKSETPLAARLRRITFDGNVSGNVSWPIDIRDVDFRVGANAVSAFVICNQSGEGGGHRFYNCNFEVDAGHATPAIFNGVIVGRDGDVIGCKFKNTGQAITLRNYPTDNNIEDNDFDTVWGDGCSGHFRNISFKNNFMYNKKFIPGSGAHTDFLQHLGILQQRLIGTGNGVATSFSFTLPDFPIVLTAALKFGDNGAPTTCQINGSSQLSGSGIVSASSPINKTTGVATLTLSFAPPNGQPIYLDYASNNGGAEWVFGEVSDNIVVRNNGTTGEVDTQAYFVDDSYGTSRFIGAVLRRNVGLITFGNGVFLKQFTNPVVEYNVLLRDVGASAGGTAASQVFIKAFGGTDGTIRYNVANNYDLTGQTSPAYEPNPNKVISADLTSYNAAFSAWTGTGLTTRAAVRAALTPKLDGSLKNADGSYNGAYLPNGSNNDVVVPAGVIASGTQVAHNTRATAGLKTTTLYTPAANAAMFPAGTNVSSGPNQIQFPVSGPAFELTDFDFTGYEVSFRGANATLRRCRFANNGGGRLLVTEGTSEVTVYDTTFDGTGLQNVHQAIVVCGGGTKLTEYDCSHIKSPKCHVDSWGQYRATRTWFGAFGWNPGVDPHQEGIFFRQGVNHQLTDCGFDISEFDSPSGETGIWYLEGEYNPTSLVATRCTMYGALANDVAYPIQLAAKNYAVSLTLIDFAVQSGPSGYVGVTEVGGNKVTVVAVNTFEYTSGAAVDLGFGYPASVTAKGLQAVWGLKETAGVKTATTKKAGVDALPAGWVMIDTIRVFAPESGTHVISGYDFTGHIVHVKGNGNITFEDCKFTNCPEGSTWKSQSLLVNVDDDGVATVTVNRSTFDFSTNTNTRESPIQNHGKLTLNYCHLSGAARDLITSTSGADGGTWDPAPVAELTVNNSYLGSFGQRGGAGAHYEQIHTNLGKLTMLNVFCDGRDGVSGVNTLTGSIYPQPRLGPATADITNCIILGRTAGAQSPYNFQFGPNEGQATPNAAVVLTNSVLSKGTSTYVSNSGAPLHGYGNIDFDTSAAIVNGSLTSSVTAAPVFSMPPRMSMPGADLDVGVTVTSDKGLVAGADTVTYQWEVDGTDLYTDYDVLARNNSFTISKALQWATPRCKVTATNAFGSTISYSNDLGRVTVDFSKNTRCGHGAMALGLGAVTISSGANMADFAMSSGELIPSGTKNNAKTWAATRYTLTLSDGTVAKVRIVDDGFTITASAADSIYNNELKTVVETTGAAGMKLGHTVWCRKSGNVWNPLAANWGLDVPVAGFAAGTGDRVTIRSEFVDYQLDANGNHRNQHGFKSGRVAVYAGAAIDCKLNFEHIWFHETNIGGTPRVLVGFGGTYTTTASGLSVYNSRFEANADVVPDIFGVRTQGRSQIHGNVFRKLGTSIQVDNSSVAGTGVSSVRENCGYELRSDHIDFKGDNVLIEFNWCFDWNEVNPADHKDFIQDFGNKTSTAYNNVKVRMNFTARNFSTEGKSDSQGLFFADSISTAVNNYEVVNNGVLNTDTKGVVICKFGPSSKVKGNVTLNDFLAGMTITYPGKIYIPIEDPGVGGEFTYNTAHAFDFSAQSGPTVSNNVVVPANWAAIRAAFPNMPVTTRDGTLNNLKALMRAFVPADLAIASGGTKHPDGRFSTPFFPDGSENDFAPYVPGRLPPIVAL